MDQQMFQVLMFIMNGLMGLFMLFLGWFLSKVTRTLERIEGDFSKLHEDILRNYVTRNELEIVRKYARDTNHDFRGDLEWVVNCLYLIAQKNQMMKELPNKPKGE